MAGNPGHNQPDHRADAHAQKDEDEKGPGNHQPEGKEVHFHGRAIVQRKDHDHDGERDGYQPVDKFHVHPMGSVGGPDSGRQRSGRFGMKFNP